MSILSDFQLLPPSEFSGPGANNNSGPVQVLSASAAQLTTGERQALLSNIENMPGIIERMQTDRFGATWMGLGVGLVLGVGGLMAFHHIYGK